MDSAIMMVEPQTSRFWQAAVESGLIDEASLRTCWNRIPEEKRTSDAIDRRLARQVIASGIMTIWQAQQVLAGRGFALKIGKYILMDLIGQGGMGRVYLARDTRLKRRVALKMLSRERMNNPRALARFEREAKVGAQLQHDNLVRIYDEGDANGLRYLVMEFIDGKNVGQLLSEGETLPPATAARIGKQVALGLQHAHEKGLIHRDVNPMNILVTRDGTAKVTDLGLAIDLGDDDMVTREGATVGTFDYISPEQARHSRSVDARTDLYSLGCSLYHMICGRVPFPTPSLPEKLYAHQLNEPASLVSVVPGVPPGLDAVVRKLMSKKPEDRYLTALDAAYALESFADSSSSLSKILPAFTESATEETTIPPNSSTPPISLQGSESAWTPPDSDPDLAWNNENRATPKPGSVRVKSPNNDVAPQNHGLDPKQGQNQSQRPAAKPVEGMLPIDLGPEPSISDTLSGVRKNKPAKPKAKWNIKVPNPVPVKFLVQKRKALVIAGTIMGFVAVLGLVFGFAIPAWRDSPSTAKSPSVPPVPVAKDSSRFPEGQAPFAVRLLSGEIIASSSLQNAMSLASRGRGEVLIGDIQEEFVIEADPLTVPQDSITLRAAEGCRPILNVRTKGRVPFLRQQSTGGILTLSGLTILVDFDGNAQQAARPVIEAGSQLVLDRCVFSVEQRKGRDLTLAKVQGVSAKVSGCLFRGFDRALDLTVFQGGSYAVRHCLFVWPEGTAGQRPGWAIRAEPALLGGVEGPCRIVLDQCSVLRGSGLIELQGVSKANPIEIALEHSAVRADHLLLWGSKEADFPNGLVWQAEDNCYDLLESNWVVLSQDRPDGPEDGPTDLDSWKDTIAIDKGRDDSSQQGMIKLRNENAFSSSTLDPARFALLGHLETGETIGADTARVGPKIDE